MTEKILYAEVNLFSSVIILLISYRIYKDSNFSKQRNALMINIFAVITFIFDILSNYFEGALNPASAYIINIFYFIFCAGVSVFWLLYVETELPIEKNRHRRNLIYFILTIIYLFILVTDPITHIVFYIDSNGEYHKSDLWFMEFIGPYIFMTISFARAIVYTKKVEDKFEKQRALILAELVFPPLIFSIPLIFTYNIPILSVGITISIILVYLNYQSEVARIRNEQEAVIAALGEDFDFVCYISATSNTIKCYRNSGLFNTVIQSRQGDYIQPKEFDSALKQLMTSEEIIKLRTYAARSYVMPILKVRPYSFNFTVTYEGKNYYYLTKFVLDKNNPDGVILGFQNIDSQFRQEKEVQKQLEEANMSKSNFLFNMSHDIRTPMNAIMGFTEIAKRNIDNKEKVMDSLLKVESSGNHLLELINNILDMAKIESGHINIDESPTNIKRANQEMCDIIQQMASSKGVIFTSEIINLKQENIWADKLHVNQVMLNILSNAVKYTKPNGYVNFKLEELEGTSKNHIRLKFVVEDSGIGMSKSFVNHIFDSFSREQTTTTSGVEGTGLGMAITKRLVDLMKGKIDIKSESGKGTTVTIIFNFRVWNVLEIEDRMPVETKTISLKGKRVLVVEDNDLNREIATDILLEEGLIVEEAEDGSVAVEKVRCSVPGYYDFILMDIQMPYKDGYFATREIRSFENKELASVPIIAMTANAFEEDKKKAIEAGMNSHLAKPVNIPALIATLQSFAF